MAINLLKTRRNIPMSVHESRKAFKKCRTALRAGKLGFKGYKDENLFFRDLGRLLSQLRDYQAVQDTLLHLYQTKDHPARRASCKIISKPLLVKKAQLERNLIRNDKLFEKIVNLLQFKLEEINNWELELASFELLAKGLKKVYKKGQKIRHKACVTGKLEDFHEWRKQAKYFYYQLEFISPLWPNYIGVLNSEFNQLTDKIGEEHDLVILEELMDTERISIKNTTRMNAFRECIDYHKQAARKESLGLGSRCYIFPAKCVKNIVQKLGAL
ncbi:CHAD domain-containing protein [Echinicola shivajiensis]|uniref:CHAD domain-containing protein n=1 Tax=Echinicola shivajiensis TaxID=1035916 RepID=UPI001BFC6AB8|nr:CHAD domain-containing protein [Echinicola shivajiensis]